MYLFNAEARGDPILKKKTYTCISALHVYIRQAWKLKLMAPHINMSISYIVIISHRTSQANIVEATNKNWHGMSIYMNVIIYLEPRA
jgi:copper(I)-binding protein